jgi:hypothetical protein
MLSILTDAQFRERDLWRMIVRKHSEYKILYSIKSLIHLCCQLNVYNCTQNDNDINVKIIEARCEYLPV